MQETETELSRLRQIVKRFCQSGSASSDNVQSYERSISDTEEELKGHKLSATQSQHFTVKPRPSVPKTGNPSQA